MWFLKWRRPLVLAALVLLVLAMWMTVAFLGACLFSSPQLTRGQRSGPVLVEVFYETLCPDSQQFILEQLSPTYQKIGSIMDVRLIPFGKAHAIKDSNGSWLFTCQHGPPECAGNLIQTCALNKYPVSKSLPLIVCMENSSRPEKSGPVCAQKLSLDYSPIEQCTRSTEGNTLQYKMAEKTLALKPRFVPWIGINNNVSAEIQTEALNHLLKTVCNTYQGKKPSGCQ